MMRKFSFKIFFTNFILLLLSTVASLLLFCFLLQGYVHLTGATIKNDYIVQPRPQQWISDPVTGYRNKPNYRHWAFGRIDGSTNTHGFRTQHDFPLKPRKGVLRIIGIGDSVMEGARANAKDAFLGILEHIIKSKGVWVETINAAVCGYSTYQERLFFEHYVLPFNPSIVLINFCKNDLLPSENPFDNLNIIHATYLEKILKERLYKFSELERQKIEDAAVFLRTEPTMRYIGRKFYGDPISRKALRRIFIQIPILEMQRLADKNNIKLIYVFISPEDDEVKLFMKSAGIDYVDCSMLLPKESGQPPFLISSRINDFAINIFSHPYVRGILSFLSFNQLDPARAIEQIGRLNAFRYQCKQRCWFDGVHPSHKGNAVIAQAIYAHLLKKNLLLLK